MQTNEDITRLLHRVTDGDADAKRLLIPMVYSEMRRMAGAYLKGERREHTLQATALVHEAYLRLIGQTQMEWRGRRHFFAIAAQTMRRVLVDHARERKAAKRGGGCERLLLQEGLLISDEHSHLVLELEEALLRLSEIDARQCEIVEMRFYGGMTEEEIGDVLGLSSRTVKREWRMARAWLFGALQPVKDRLTA